MHDEKLVTFTEHLTKIDEHNRRNKDFKIGLNEFADMPSSEFVKKMNGYKYKPNQGALKNDIKETNNFQYLALANVQIPNTVDWRTSGAVTPIKNQGQCGSCWAFSATGALEGQVFRKKGKLTPLSEQNLVDCSDSHGNDGCNGGWMNSAFQYVIDNKGIETSVSYPYTAKDGTCQFNETNVGATCGAFVDLPVGNELLLQQAVATIGPISVAIDASRLSFQLYKSGVYSEPACSSTDLDHAVLVIGYGTQAGRAYWLVKNSWGTGWGENGYIKIARNAKNKCGIASAASYPMV